MNSIKRNYEWKREDFLENIRLEKKGDVIHVMNGDSSVVFSTPEMRLPFGLDKQYNGYQAKLQCNQWDYKKGDQVQFINFLETFENHLRSLLGVSKDNLGSQVYYHHKFPPIVSTKIIIGKNDSIITESIDTSNRPLNIFKLDKGETVICKLMVDTIRPYKGKLWYKLKCKKIICVKSN